MQLAGDNVVDRAVDGQSRRNGMFLGALEPAYGRQPTFRTTGVGPELERTSWRSGTGGPGRLDRSV